MDPVFCGQCGAGELDRIEYVEPTLFADGFGLWVVVLVCRVCEWSHRAEVFGPNLAAVKA